MFLLSYIGDVGLRAKQEMAAIAELAFEQVEGAAELALGLG